MKIKKREKNKHKIRDNIKRKKNRRKRKFKKSKFKVHKIAQRSRENLYCVGRQGTEQAT